MQSGIYVALSGQIARERRLATVAHNVANMNTPGFRATGIGFEAELGRTGDVKTAFASPGADFISRRAGALSKTDNALDVAVQGEGWFGMKIGDGVVYSRDGRMRLSETGALETITGGAMLDAGGAPIVLDAAGGAPQIAQDGMITQSGRQVGALGLFSLDPSAALTRAANSGVVPDKPAAAILDFSKNGVVQGYVENSNLDPVLEITKLISLSREFDAINTSVSLSESSLRDAIRTLAATS